LIYKVSLPIPGVDFFDYLAPNDKLRKVRAGCRVEVPFGNSKRIGIVVGEQVKSDLPADKLKQIAKVLDDKEPVLNAEVFALLMRAANYYHHPLGEVLSTALPVLLRKGMRCEHAYQEYWNTTAAGDDATETDLGRAKKQWRLLQYLKDAALGRSANDLVRHQMSWRVLIKSLQKKKLVTQKYRLPLPPLQYQQQSTPLKLNDQQQQAVHEVTTNVNKFKVSLLHGVTGSGKTEVYLNLIAPIIARKKQVLVLVPEIGLTPQLYRRIAERFETPVVVLHSGLNDNERLNAWQAARLGEAGIILGTRSAVFTPLPALGLVIIDEEHDASFKQIEGFRYNARDMAVMRAQMSDVPIVMGSATPSLESLHKVTQGHYQLLRLDQRAGAAVPPNFQLVDLRAQRLFGPLSGNLAGAMRDTLAAGEQVMLFINRRGFAPAMLCHTCGAIHVCKQCSSNTTYHAGINQLRCHHCGFRQPAPKHCSECNSEELVTAGSGTEQIESLVAEHFPDYSVVRIDRDTMSRKGLLQKTLAEVAEKKHQIIIGTQLLAKGHDFENITLVGLIDVDQGLFSVDFRAPERLAQQITQVGGRAGRGSRPGKVIVQTHQPEHPFFTLLLGEGIREFCRAELELRRAAQLPPYSFMAMLRSSAPNSELAEKFLRETAGIFQALDNGLEILGPVPAPMEKKAGRFRWQLLLQTSDRSALHQAITLFLPQIRALKSSKRVRWSIDVDPIDLA